jgi:CRP/FNR family cyclic AMP-dependent transcriptional regulator
MRVAGPKARSAQSYLSRESSGRQPLKRPQSAIWLRRPFRLAPSQDAEVIDMPNASPPPANAAELRNIGLFAALSDDALAHLTACLTLLSPLPGEVVFREGAEAREMYVVISGEMEVVKRSKRGIDARVALLGPGDWFGEMSILDVQPRSATVRALAPTRMLRISSSDLDGLYRFDVKSYALIVLNLARELSRRLRVADGIIADFVASVTESYNLHRDER